MKRSRLSLPGRAKPRKQRQQKQQLHQHHQQHQRGDIVAADAMVGGQAVPAAGSPPPQQSPVTSSSPRLGTPFPARPTSPARPPNGTDTVDKKRSPGNASPHSNRKSLPSSPWAHVSSARKRPRATTYPGSTQSPARQQRQHDPSVIDLTSETCHSGNEESGLCQQGEEEPTVSAAKATLSSPPRLPPPLPPPVSATDTTTTTTTTASSRGGPPLELDPESDRPPRSTSSAAPEASSSSVPFTTSPGAPLPTLPPLQQLQERMLTTPPTISATGTSELSSPSLLSAATKPSPPPRPPQEATTTDQGREEGQRPPPRSTYLRHFEDAVGTVMRSRPDYARLFTPEELEVARSFERLSEPSKTLYVRLFQRKGPWFRADGMLGYDEVGSGTPLWVRRRNAADAAEAAAAAADVATAAAAAAAIAATVASGEDSTSDAAAPGADCETRGGSAPVFLAPSPFPSAGAEIPMPPRAHDEQTEGSTLSAERGGAAEGESVLTPTEAQRDRVGEQESFTDVITSRSQGGAIASAIVTVAAAESAVAEAELAAAEAAAVAAAAADSVAFTPRELTVLHGEIQTALHELVEAGFLDALPDDVGRTGPGLEAALAAVACCVKSPELKALLKRTGGNGKKTTPMKCPAGGRKPPLKGRSRAGAAAVVAREGGRRDMLEELRRRLAGQQTLWGVKSPLVREIERLISASVEALGVRTTTRTSCGGSDNSRMVRSSPQGKKQRSHWLVAVAGSPRMVFKRALRLMYLTCDTSALSSGRVGAASVRGPAVAGALSSWSPGLSAAFGKTRYASYVCDPQAKAFQGREDFLRWEAAVELRCALDAAMEEMSRERSESKPALAAASAAESEEEEEEKEKEEEVEEDRDAEDEASEGRWSTKTEVLVLDSDGELEIIEDALIAPKLAEDGPRVKAETHEERLKNEEGATTAVGEKMQEEQQEVRASIIELDGMLAQFLPEGKEQAGRIATAVTAAATTTTSSTSTATAVAIALLCSRCLHAHLGTQAVALRSQIWSPLSSTFGATTEAMESGLENDGGGEKEEEGVFLRLLEERCAVRESLDAGPRPVRDMEVAEDVKLDGGNGDAGGVVNWCGRGRPQQGERGSPHDTKESQWQLASGAVAERICSSLFSEAAAHETLMVEGEARGSTEEDRKDPSRTAIDLENDGDSCNKDVPEFLLQLEAGWVLASAVWEGVALVERARNYERAVELLSKLLATRYTPHRRGRWWDRLSLDLAHTKRLACALWASQEGLKDPQVRGGDRLALEKRAAMLTTRASNRKRNAGSKKVQARTSCTQALPVSTSAVPSSSLPEQSVPEGRATGCESEGDGGGRRRGVSDDDDGDDNDDDGDDGNDDDDDVFEDPAVERERRRTQKLRHRERQRRRQRQRQQQEEEKPQPRGQQPVRGRSSSGSIDMGRSHEVTITKATLPSVGPAASSNNVETAPHDADFVALPGESADGSSSSGLDQEGVITGASDSCAATEVKPGVAAAAAKAKSSRTALAQTLRCDGVAQLSQVPDLLNDESIASVVLAATAAVSEKTAADGGPGVPEMSITGRRLNREIGVKSRFVGYGDGSACTVESLVLQHLSQREEGGWVGWHCEGSPLRALWALLMWDVIFMDVADVFQTPFQDAPLDLDFCPLFYLNRRAAVDARLAEVRAASTIDLVALVGDAWMANANTVCRGLNWDRSSVRHLQAIAAGLGGRAVAAILSALCLNHKHFGGGLPDLLLMRAVRTHGETIAAGEENGGNTPGEVAPTALVSASPDTELEFSTPESLVSWLGVESGVAFGVDGGQHEGGAQPPIRSAGGGRSVSGGAGVEVPPPFKADDMKGLRLEVWLLEVKGPSDRLSDRQTAWLRILDRGQALVGVCHVSEGAGGSHAAAAVPAVAFDTTIKMAKKEERNG